MNNYYEVSIFNKIFKFYVLDNCIISNYIKNNKIWEKYLHNVFKKYVNENSIVVECGCHIGAHSLVLASLCKTFYGFEPMPTTYDILNKNIELNNITNAMIYKKGVSNKEGITQFCWIPEGNPGGSGLSDNPMGIPTWITRTNKHIDVELTTIDSLQLDKLDFIKIDVEGYETLAIDGAINTIKKCRPVIVMEVWKNHYGEYDINHTKNIFKNILELGYGVVHLLGPDYLFVPNESL